MSDYKNSVKNTTRIQREKLRDTALAYSTLGAPRPSKEAMKLVNEYVDGKIEIADALEIIINKYKTE